MSGDIGEYRGTRSLEFGAAVSVSQNEMSNNRTAGDFTFDLADLKGPQVSRSREPKGFAPLSDISDD